MGRAFTFFGFVWIIVAMVGGVVQGSNQLAATYLTADITATTNTIYVRSTTGFPDTGTMVIGNETIAYYQKSATAFSGNIVHPLVRGAVSTAAAAHTAGAIVRSPEGAMLNTAVTYNVSVITDPSGVLAWLQEPVAFISLIGSFLLLPLGFLGLDLSVIATIWLVLVAGLLLSLGIVLASGRRVNL